MDRSLADRVMLIALSTLASLVLFSAAIHALGVDRTLWGTDVAIIAFGTLVAAVATAAVLRRYDALRQLLLEQETAAHQRAEAALAWEIETNAELARQAAALLALPPASDPSPLILEAAQRLTHSPYGYVGVLDPHSGQVVAAALTPGVYDACRVSSKEETFKTLSGLSGWVIEHREPVLSNSPEGDARAAGVPPGHVPILRFLSAPALAGGEVLGQLALANADHDYGEPDLLVAQRLASLFGLAVQRRRADQAVHDSEARYRSLYEGIPVGLYRTAPDGRILDANEALVRLLACPDRAALLAVNAGTFYVDPEERARQGAMLQRGELVQGVEMQLRRLDGRLIWVRNTMRAVCDEAGHIQYHDGALEDVTERHNAQQAEHEQRALADALRDTGAALADALTLNEVLDIILERAARVVPHAASTIMLVDNGMARVVRSRGYDTLGSAEAVERLHLSLDQFQAAANAMRLGRPVVTADTGDQPGWFNHSPTLWIRSQISVPIHVKGRAIGLLNLDSPIPGFFAGTETASLQAFADQVGTAVENARLYQQAVDERTRLQALIDSNRDGIVLCGTDERILTLNEPALRFWHLPGPTSQWLGRPILEAMETLAKAQPAAAELGLGELARLQREAAAPPVDGILLTSQGATYWQNLPVTVDSVPLGRLVTLRDITAERAAEQMREDLTRMLVHDLRNPLGIITNTLQLLYTAAGLDLEGSVREMFEIATSATDRMQRLVDSILDVSQLESGKVSIEPRPFSVAALIDETLRLQAPVANARPVTLNGSVPPGLPDALGDSAMIGRVLQNLVDNAIRFTPPGGAVVIAAATADHDERTWVHVSVNDTGPGVSPAFTGRLFRKFSRGPQQGRGSGLGLAFCKLAVEAHGGAIWLDASADRGARFVFSLPAT